MKKYILDLSDVKLPEWWPETTPRKIIVQDGKYLKDYDVAPEEMEKSWAYSHRQMGDARRIKRGFNAADPALPIGFDSDEMPKGAKLVEQS